MEKKLWLLAGAVIASTLFASQALAHTTVKPASVGIGKFQTFTVSAPSEKPIPTIGVRLVLPGGLNYISPNVKPGWKVEVKKAIINGEEKATEIIWTGGKIPAEMRDEFNFSAQVPSQPTILNWKAYQTYQDGTMVAWDQDPTITTDHDNDFSTMGPYSRTEVIDDLSSPTSTASSQKSTETTGRIALALSIVSLLIAIGGLRKNSHKN